MARLRYGDSLAAESRSEGEVPVYGSNGPSGFHSVGNTLAPALIIGRKGSFGKVNFSERTCFAIDTAFYIDRRSSHSDLRWLYYVLLVLRLDAISEDSAVPGLSREFAHDQTVVVPPLEEQHVIAAFLDRETEKIDALIEKKERLVALLEEKRTALLGRAVTKGLTPSAPMKESGLDWLDEIPAHWEPMRLRFAIRAGTQNGLYKSRGYHGEGGVPIISMAEAFTSAEIGSCAEDRVDLTAAEYQSYKLEYGDLLFARRSLVFSGSGRCSMVGSLPEPHVFESSIIRARPMADILDPRFASVYLNSTPSRFQILRATKQVTISGIDADAVKDILLFLPPLEEQRAIVANVDSLAAKIVKLISKIRSNVEMLRGYRSDLISAGVTGKVDVRGEGVA